MEGTLLSFSAQVGGMASPSASLGTIITDKDVEIHFDVVERYLSLVKEGQKVILSFAAYPDETFSGTITRLSPVVDGQSRTRKAYCKLDTPDERIIPGMYAKILLVEQHHDNALLVPSSAVVSHEDGSVIFVLSGNVAKMMKVKTGIQADGMTEIVSGLAKNSVIITQGQATLSDGSPVTVTSQGKGAGQ
jgi:RND family efflux transporter MFP subunit